MKRARAFTLIELLVVIAIIGLLASIVLAALSSARTKASVAAGLTFSDNVDHAIGDQAVGWWDFNDCTGTTALDRSGGGFTGTLVNGPTWSTNTASNTGCSVSFNGTNQYVTMGNVGAFANNFAVAVWVYKSTPYTSSINGWTILGKRNNVAAGYQIETDSNGLLRWRVFNGGNQNVQNSTATLGTGQWYQILVSYTPLTAKFYVNGVLSGTATFLYDPSVDTTAFTAAYIGIGSGGSYWDGLEDNIRIYGAPLSAAQAKELYAEEAPKYHVAAAPIDH